jgi:uncharacterized protein YuzE
MAKNKNYFSVDYDNEQDILYLSFTKSAKEAIAEEISDEVFLRFDPQENKIVNIEILNFRHRIEKSIEDGKKAVKSALNETYLLPE